jgi:hypothetical protein
MHRPSRCVRHISASGDATRCELERGTGMKAGGGGGGGGVDPHQIHPWTVQAGCVMLAVPHFMGAG